MHFGATTWPFSWAPPYDEAIKEIAKLDFSSVELTVWNEDFLNEYYTPETNRFLNRLIVNEGLTLSEVFCIPPGIASPNAAARAASVEYFKRILDTAKQLGTDLVIALAPNPFELDFPVLLDRPTSQEWTVEIPRGLDWGRNWKDMVSTLRQFADACEKRDMVFALEPHPHRMMHNADGMLRILDQVESSAIGLNLDPSHLFPSGEIPQVVVYKVGQRVFHTHLSDNDGQTNAHWRPGKGKVDWRRTLRALDDIGYDGALSLELEDVPGAAGYPGFGRSPHSTPQISTEYRLAREYLARICQEEGIEVESGS